MGGRAFEDLAERGFFAAVMDFSLQELVNDMNGSCVTAGPDRLRGAGRRGTPQIVAPGATDMVDYATWGQAPARFAGRPRHEHNRLIASASIDAPARRDLLRRTLAGLLQDLGPGFVQTHRSAAVALAAVRHVAALDGGEARVHLLDGSQVRCSRQRRAELLARLCHG